MPLSPRYESGDHVAVYPANDSALVNQIGEILGADLDVVMSLNNLDGEIWNQGHSPCLPGPEVVDRNKSLGKARRLSCLGLKPQYPVINSVANLGGREQK